MNFKSIMLPLGGVLPIGALPAAEAQSKMNVLFIAVDDLKPALNCFGDSRALTPNIDRMAKSGVAFTHNYCQYSWSSPSRASLLFGQTPDQTQIWNLSTKLRDKNPETVAIPENFKRNGYYVAGAGKIFHIEAVDEGHDSRSWNEYVTYDKYPYYRPAELSENMPEGLGGYFEPDNVANLDRLRRQVMESGMSAEQARKYVGKIFRPPYEGTDTPNELYTDGITPIVVNSLIDKAHSTDKPFFIAAGFHRPHLPFIVPKKYWDLYDEDDFELASFRQKSAGAPDIAFHASEELRTYKTGDTSRWNPTLTNADELVDLSAQEQCRLMHGYYASVSFADAQIGKIYDHLESTGLLSSTIIVLWGDHGWHLGDHGMWCKQSDFENATRAPLMIIDPRAAERIVSGQLSEFMDIYPTLCDLVGITVPHGMGGVSLRPIICGLDEPVKEYAVSQYRKNKVMGYSIRTDRFRYTVWIDGEPQYEQSVDRDKIVGEEFYDYQNDPLETVSLIDDPTCRSELRRHRVLFNEYFTTKRYK